eukprot:CAMPEP_0183310640 /NCGR_PEP_ID=MMETSP0160_2-20130417/32422_1 /TAXON_ID=2839 ORGANISM="Odontella Sinensis, Strain Grunow 1884" /NCGR_SAMPLE_ID=MMETSP0160_2 /ASSEMBLY_ACC=CAM_ASM_000250 /LENGTH=55 /DNA_ID=CAMNT_0025474939 /DNA_START=54 /DNA_END=218 /DNA_ORIENTATION=+
MAHLNTTPNMPIHHSAHVETPRHRPPQDSEDEVIGRIRAMRRQEDGPYRTGDYLR